MRAGPLPELPRSVAIQRYYGAHDVGLFGIGRKLKRLSRKLKRSARSVSRGIKRTTRTVSRGVKKASRTVSRGVKRYGASALRYAATGASFVPGVGTGVAAGLSAASAIAAGKSLRQIAEQAALGALPGGALAQTGARFALAAARGQRLDRAALGAARAAVPGGALGRAAFDVTRAGLSGQRVDRALLAAAKRHGGAIVRQNVPGVSNMRPFTTPRILRKIGRRAVPAVIPHGRGTMLAAAAMTRNPRLGALPAEEAARSLGIATRHILQARQLTGAALQWSGLPNRTAAFVRRTAPLARYVSRRDTAGLAPDGRSYTMESGDYLSKIAQQITGSAARWKELLPVNPKYPRHSQWGMVMHPGDVLVLPESWWPEPSPETMTAASIIQAKAILVTWSKTAGANQAGPTDYGQRPEDISPTWTERDRLELASFGSWRGFSTDGELTQPALDELKAWAAEAATGAAATVPASASPVAVSMPNEIPQMGTTPATSIALPTELPSDLTLPDTNLTSAGAGTTSAAGPATPVVYEDFGPGTVPAAAPAKKKQDSSGLGIAAAITLAALFL